VKGNNEQLDLLFLPTTPFGFKYLLVAVDLATNEFDIEQIKNKEPSTILKAYQKMFKRKYIESPKVTVTTDGGNEFKGVFGNWLEDNAIFHRTTIPDRHKQTGNVESLNKQLGRLIIGYLNMKEIESGKTQKNWLGIIDTIRKELNKIRKHGIPADINSFVYPHANPVVKDKKGKESFINPKYKVNDMVYYKSEVPLDGLGRKQPTKQFRTADYRWNKDPKKITKIFYYSPPINYRYQLSGLKNVSYTEAELKPA
jgi:hypothetical protein